MLAYIALNGCPYKNNQNDILSSKVKYHMQQFFNNIMKSFYQIRRPYTSMSLSSLTPPSMENLAGQSLQVYNHGWTIGG